jgi:curved DNA-binding protein CbpA
MAIPANHYQILGIDIQADDAAIKKAYKKAALENHPDKTLHLSAAQVEERTKLFKLATTAYEILLDPVLRADYNRSLAQTLRLSYAPTTQPSESQYQRPSPKSAPQRPNPFQPPKFHPFTQADVQPPPKTPNRHPFTAGSPPGTFGTTSSPWFHAPVTEDPTRTILSFDNSAGWSFSIGVSKKYKWIRRPVLPLLETDTKNEITIRICMKRNTYSSAYNALKDVVLCLTSAPENKRTAFSSIFAENRQGMELCITIGALTTSPTEPTLAWKWAFDVDLGFLIPFYKELRATHLMFYPQFPRHAVGENGAVPAKKPFPMGSPAAGLVSIFEEMSFVAMTKGFYCEEMEYLGRRFWRLAAVGSI